jgi:hypothetical protein
MGPSFTISHVQGLLARSHHLGRRTLSRDPNTQFTWEIFLHVPEVHIWLLLYMGVFYSAYRDLQTNIRAKLVTYAIFGFLGPYNNYTCHNSVISRNGSTTKAIIRKHTAKVHILDILNFFRFENNSFLMNQFGAHLFRKEKLEVKTNNPHGNSFYM